jgi:cellulose 1,4-beta-cellobiosidase
MTVDTKSKFTVVTQFLGSGSTLSEIKRFYVQNGKVIANPQPKTPGITGNSITQAWCDAENKANNEEVYPFKDHGGMASMASAMAKGMVLVMSLWDDHYANMLWLDSTYPTDATGPGTQRGSCATSSGVPSDVESNGASTQVTYSNIKFGPIGSTFQQPS